MKDYFLSLALNYKIHVSHFSHSILQVKRVERKGLKKIAEEMTMKQRQ